MACNRGLRARSGDLIERLVELRGEGRLVGEEREGKAEVRRGLRLHHIQRLAGGVEVFFQHPALHLRALIGKDDLVVIVFDRGRGFQLGCNRWRDSVNRCGGQLRLDSGAGGRKRGLRLVGRLALALRGGRRRGRLLRLEKVLVAEQYDEEQKGERHQAAAIAASASTALSLKIGIAEFCQGILPVRLGLFSAHGEAPSGRHSFYGKGSWGNGCAIAAGGTGSRPPRVKGWQRSSLQDASRTPRSGPCVAMACVAYSEQVGKNLQPPPGLSECSAGEIQRR